MNDFKDKIKQDRRSFSLANGGSDIESGHNDQAAPIFRPAGDSALIVEFADNPVADANQSAIAFDAELRRAGLPGVIETAPTIRSVLVRYDPASISVVRLGDELRHVMARIDWQSAASADGRRLWYIPALYGGSAGPDLAEIADQMGLSEDAAIAEHAATRQRVAMLGFAPGFAYLGTLPQRWNIPRLKTVKPFVPAGSISVAIRQTVLCATDIPTGWHTIANTAFRGFDAQRDPAFLIEPGDHMIFEPVSIKEHARLCMLAAEGKAVARLERQP